MGLKTKKLLTKDERELLIKQNPGIVTTIKEIDGLKVTRVIYPNKDQSHHVMIEDLYDHLLSKFEIPGYLTYAPEIIESREEEIDVETEEIIEDVVEDLRPETTKLVLEDSEIGEDVITLKGKVFLGKDEPTEYGFCYDLTSDEDEFIYVPVTTKNTDIELELPVDTDINTVYVYAQVGSVKIYGSKE